MAPARTELDPGAIEAIAARVAELVEERAPTRTPLVDAAELARVLRVERGWVYRRAARLGAIRLDDRPGAPLRPVEDFVLTNFTETAVLLGAGASAEAGVPTSFEMTDRLVARIREVLNRRADPSRELADQALHEDVLGFGIST